MADATNLDKKYLYKISRSGNFLGILQNVISEFTTQQDINSAGTSLVIQVADTADRQFEAPEAILEENGNILTDELGNSLLIERAPDLVGNNNSAALIRNNNTIQVYEISPNYPNGLLVFSGWISRWKANYGGSEVITITCLSNGSELDNYLILGQETTDQSQLVAGNASSVIKDFGGEFVGQTFTTGAGITSISAISLLLNTTTGGALTGTLKLWQNPASATGYPNLTGTPLASKSRQVSGTTPTELEFTFDAPVTVTPLTSYFWTMEGDTFPADSNQIRVGLNLTTPNSYANGSGYIGGGSSGVWTPWSAFSPFNDYDYYFKTLYTAGATSSPYTSQDPTAILRSIIDNYVARGGSINYATGSTVLTGLSRSYTFKVNTILEGIKKCLELAPYDWYWYVDPATNTIYFKEASTTADHTMVYGRHLQSLDIEASVEEVITQVYFTGGDTGGNVYLYQSLNSATALAANAGRVGMKRISDNRVTLSATATALMTNYLNANNAENYQTTIIVNAAAYDINLFNLGQIVGFDSFASFVDQLLLQIVHIERHPDYVVLGLGVIPQRASSLVEDIQRDLNDVQTIYNPTTPS